MFAILLPGVDHAHHLAHVIRRWKMLSPHSMVKTFSALSQIGTLACPRERVFSRDRRITAWHVGGCLTRLPVEALSVIAGMRNGMKEDRIDCPRTGDRVDAVRVVAERGLGASATTCGERLYTGSAGQNQS